MDLEWHEFTNFGQDNNHPADQWIEWERRDLDAKKYQEQLKLEKIDEDTKEKEFHLLLKIIENCKRKANNG
tara:strand:- start:508 stop:720 length:213 start_codon:yes stop_codon:yes gene_type:complete